MTLLSRILGAKKAADAHHAALTQQSALPSPTIEVPYRHIPTHAKVDSLNLGASLPSPDLHERIKAENKRNSRIAVHRTGSDTYLEHRSSLAAKRSTRELAMLAASKGKEPMTPVNTTKNPMNMYLAPTSNPYAMSPMPSPRRGRSPVGSMSPASSVRSAPRSPGVGSIAEETEVNDETPRPLLRDAPAATPSSKVTGKVEQDGCFPVQI